MKLVILSAGIGKRLHPLTKDIPKPLIKIGNKTLIERQINVAKSSKLFNEIVIITGYKWEQVMESVGKIKGIKIETIYNPFYEISGPLISIWTAHYKMKEDNFVITNGDNIYKPYVFKKIIPHEDEIIQLAICFKNHYQKDDMKVKLDRFKNVIKAHKNLPLKETHAVSVGLALIKGEKSRKIFLNKVLELVKKREYLFPNVYWHEIFNSLIQDNVTIKTCEIGENDWLEIDTYKDLEKIKDFVKE